MRRSKARRTTLIPRARFFRRLALHGGLALAMLLFLLGVGVLGYHVWVRLGWLDAFLNASMILAGMGPVSDVGTTGGKLFAGFYAITSGVLFLTTVGVFFAPILHRMLYRFHLEQMADEAR